MQRLAQVLARVRLAQLPQVRQELLLHVNPEISWLEVKVGRQINAPLSPLRETFGRLLSS